MAMCPELFEFVHFCLITCLFSYTVSNRKIDEIYYLQNYKEGWTNGKWEEKMDERRCIERNSFVQVNDLELFTYKV